MTPFQGSQATTASQGQRQQRIKPDLTPAPNALQLPQYQGAVGGLDPKCPPKAWSPAWPLLSAGGPFGGLRTEDVAQLDERFPGRQQPWIRSSAPHKLGVVVHAWKIICSHRILSPSIGLALSRPNGPNRPETHSDRPANTAATSGRPLSNTASSTVPAFVGKGVDPGEAGKCRDAETGAARGRAGQHTARDAPPPPRPAPPAPRGVQRGPGVTALSLRVQGGGGERAAWGKRGGPEGAEAPPPPRRSGGSAGCPHRPELARRRRRRRRRRGGDAGPVPTQPALPCPGAAPARRGGAGDRGRIHVPAAPAAQPRDRRRSGSMRRARTGSPAGSGRLRLASAPALVAAAAAAAAAAPHSPPRLPAPPPPTASLRPRPRPARQSDAALPARVTAGTAAFPPLGPSLGKAEPLPSRQSAPSPRGALRPPVHLENPRRHWGAAAPKTRSPAPRSSLPQKDSSDRVSNSGSSPNPSATGASPCCRRGARRLSGGVSQREAIEFRALGVGFQPAGRWTTERVL
ncbi:uncharacterized protein LOC121832676 [Peromyscus maniculatus bairdii]|uniref:uncharacterized protein LOC121832676 n=1 Tax=Peromyscus maniculatus bairdii TaxID=230844 RepID=UPI003FD1B80C